jgi:uncharacterized membrane protein YfcA
MSNIHMTIWKYLHVSFMFALLFFDAILLDLDKAQIAVSLIGTISGAFVLTYYRKELTWTDRLLKMLASALGGMFVGTALNSYLGFIGTQNDNLSYAGVVWFIASFLVLVILRAILALTEKNASGVVTTIAKKILPTFDGVETKTEIVTTGATVEEVKHVHKEIAKNQTKEL